MNHFILTSLVAVSLLATSGCAAVATRAPVTGFLYSDVAAGENISSNAGTTKQGEACAASILGLIGTGDASINAAAKEGGIAKIAYVDGKSSNILGIYAKYCTVVYGE